jgi:predicted O-linked N-acetylglucosamine transferase (SPINDLY family)
VGQASFDGTGLEGTYARLAANRETHPPFDTNRFTRNLENAHVEMWKRAERGEASQHFAVSSVA